MESLMFWGIPLLFALLGLKRQLFRSWLAFWHMLFALYLGFWSADALAPYMTGALPPNFQSCSVIAAFAAVFLVVWLTLFFTARALCREHEDGFSFPKSIDRLGGALCGFGTGMVLVTFSSSLLVLSPVRNQTGGTVDIEIVKERAVSNLWKLTGLVNNLTFQNGREEEFSYLRDRMLTDAEQAANKMDARIKTLSEQQQEKPQDSPEAGGDASGESRSEGPDTISAGGTPVPKGGLIRRLVDPAVRGQDSVNERTNREL